VTWRPVELAMVAQLAKRFEVLEPTGSYRQVGVRLWGAGAYERGTITGAETQYSTFSRLEADDIIVNKIWARNGSVSVVGDELSGCYGSPEFPIYQIDKSQLFPRFFFWFTKTRMLWDQCDLQSRGTSGQNRLKPDNFLKIKIPLPPIKQQKIIAQRLDSIETQLKGRMAALRSIEHDTAAMLQNAFNKIVEGADYRPLGEVAPLVRRPVNVELDGEYPELGVRSFGKGTFHKPVLTGADVGNKRLFEIQQGDLLFNIVFAWEGAIAVPCDDDHRRVGSHRFLTCVPKPEVATAEFLRYYLLSPEGLHKVGKASPGGAGRNRTLGIKKAEQIMVPVPTIEHQRHFDRLFAHVEKIRTIRASTTKDANALIPAMLHEIFEKPLTSEPAPAASTSTVVALPVRSHPATVDTPFKEAVLVGAIINAFHEEGGQPLGNFRLQKAVYFARRFMGETALDGEYLRKAAGPYNPTMRYSGGMKVALDKNWIAPATGKYGPGHSPGSAIDDAASWIEKYSFAQAAAWVRDRFKFKQNDIWELLATIDYAMLALNHRGATARAQAVLDYIDQDPEWHPKIAKLGLTEPAIQNAMVELTSLFDVAQGGREVST
jgi:hypothetical protein